jgi:hypothetical protein
MPTWARRAASGLCTLVIVMSVGAPSGCGDDGPTPEAKAINSAITSTVTVTVLPSGFDPPTLMVERGVNVDFAITVAARLTGLQDGATVFDSGPQGAGSNYTWRPGAAGIVAISGALAAQGTAPIATKITVTEPTTTR